MNTPALLPAVLERIATGVAPEALTDRNLAALASQPERCPEPPETTAQRLAVAWSAFERHRSNTQEDKRLILAAPACSAMWDRCDLQCAVIASGVRHAYHLHQQALQASGDPLVHDGRFYSTPAGRA